MALTRSNRAAIEKLTREAEHAALESRTQQELILNSMTEGVLVLSEDCHIRLVNRAFTNLFGVKGDPRSRTIIDAVRSHELSALAESIVSGQQVIGHELRFSDPAERLLQVNGTKLLDSDGQSRGIIMVFHDLTRLKQLERTRQEFVANVSHELRTPLSLIKGYAETLLDGAKDNPEVSTKFLQTIQRNAERLRLLIEDLLTVSQLESGRLVLQLQPVELRGIVEKVLADLKARADGKGVTLVNETLGLRVQADPARLEQVLTNLVDNAIKYGRTDGTTVVSARTIESGMTEVAVKDDGPGIPASSLERVFERFYRLDKARSREQGGTGLGLAIVKHIVQSHGGKAWADSQPGEGAVFRFTLPTAT